jgi:PII-like signaling protein
VSEDALKLSVYFGESDRVGPRLLSDALVDAFDEHRVHVAVLMRAVEGFGLAQTLRTDRFLSLSEDLPLVAEAVDGRDAIEALVPRVTELVAGGLVTLERTRLLRAPLADAGPVAANGAAAKLTVHLGRDERVRRRAAFLEAVDLLHGIGLAGCTALLGVDGTTHGTRRRARFVSRNAAVPLTVAAVGDEQRIGRAARSLAAALRDPILTLERVVVCKRDGELLASPPLVPERDDAGLGLWTKLTVHSGADARHAGRPLHSELIRRLRAAGASGATSLRGVYGFSGDHPPYGDRLFRVRRRVPVVTTIVDRPERSRRWFEIVDEVTDEAGLVTTELVPAYHALADGGRVGGTQLARPPG